MRAVIVACTTSKVGGVSGVERAVVRGLLWPSRACMTRRDTPRSNRGVASECRRVGMEASLGSPLWRTTAVNVFWREVADRGAEPSRAGNTPGRGRWRCQYARHHSSTRGANGTRRSLPPLPWRTRTSLRCASMSETGSWVPSVRRRPQA
jgi:hypothetical protein